MTRFSHLFARVLRSRRVIVAFTTFALAVLMTALPELSEVQGELLIVLLTLALALIGGYSVEEAATIARQQPSLAVNEDLRHLVREAIAVALDELLRGAPPPNNDGV